MKQTFFLLISSVLLISSCASQMVQSQKRIEPETAPKVENQSAAKFVLIELFTSEGCSSCPPADRALTFLDQQQPVGGAQIITLSMHVDYWNNLGWKDPFSAAQFSERQNFYSNTFRLGEVYTPQMVVDGATQFVGGNTGEATKAVMNAAKIQKANVALAVNQDKLQVKISDLPEHTKANVFLAIAEDNLATEVKRGENGGQTLRHSSVVRELRTVGSIAATDKKFDSEFVFQTAPAWKKADLKLVVFVQVEQGSKIIGVNQIKL